jgi:hypothetical protein
MPTYWEICIVGFISVSIVTAYHAYLHIWTPLSEKWAIKDHLYNAFFTSEMDTSTDLPEIDYSYELNWLTQRFRNGADLVFPTLVEGKMGISKSWMGKKLVKIWREKGRPATYISFKEGQQGGYKKLEDLEASILSQVGLIEEDYIHKKFTLYTLWKYCKKLAKEGNIPLIVFDDIQVLFKNAYMHEATIHSIFMVFQSLGSNGIAHVVYFSSDYSVRNQAGRGTHFNHQFNSFFSVWSGPRYFTLFSC